MGETIDAIKEKLSPHHLLQEATETIKSAAAKPAREMVDVTRTTARGLGTGLVRFVGSNPILTVLIGIGIGWLWLAGLRQRSG